MKTPLNTCPYCGSEDINTLDHDIYQDTLQLVVECECCNCDRVWVAEFDLKLTKLEKEEN